MIYILLGPDDYTKRGYVQKLAEKAQSKPVVFTDAEEVGSLNTLLGTDLFSKQSTYIFLELAEKVLAEQALDSLESSKNNFFFVQEKLDKRTNLYKALLKKKGVIQEFVLPHGKELDSWIKARAQELGVTIEAVAVNALAQKLGRDDAVETKFGGKVVEVKEVYTLWQADSELRKLAAYAGTKSISKADVELLVSEHGEVDVLKIVNAIGEGNKLQALGMIDSFLRSELASDEKAKIIQLNALLADQFRNIAIVQGLTLQNTSEAIVLEMTGWKSGRLFVIKKLSSRFTTAKINDVMAKLEALDEELKTGNTPPRVLLDMIMVQLLA